MFDDSIRLQRPGTLQMLAPITGRVLRRIARSFEAHNPEGSLIVELPDGDVVRFGRSSGGGEPRLTMRNHRLFGKALRSGSIGFAEAYMNGDIECTDLAGLFRFYLRNRAALEACARSLFTVRLPDRIMHLIRRNSLSGSRRNISDHYDLGNAFFGAWLDGDMHYSSGLYGDAGDSLETAQSKKLERIIELLDGRDPADILEIGCGWGAFARRAAADGHRVTGLTLSREQLAWSRDGALAAGLSAQCDFLLQDYREVEGSYDRVVSIEMIEAVGEAYWPSYFRVLHDRLKRGGSAVIQAITIDEAHFDRYRKSADFIQRYIFPGGMLPTRRVIAEQAGKAGLVLDHCEHFGLSYAATLREWARRFEAAWPDIAPLGFDEHFRRRWRYYLAYCEAGFEEYMIDVGLYRLKRPA